MSREEGKHEITYQMTMSAARHMLENGMISKEEYLKFDSEMQQKYEASLLCVGRKALC